MAFAGRIGQRLREVAEMSTAAAADRHGNGLLPVLTSREAAAADQIEELFPDLVQRSMAANDGEGWRAGVLAADMATFVVQPELFGAVA